MYCPIIIIITIIIIIIIIIMIINNIKEVNRTVFLLSIIYFWG